MPSGGNRLCWFCLLGLVGELGVGAVAVEAADDVAGLLFPLGVGVGVGGDLDGLGGVGDAHVLPAADAGEALVEGGRGVDRVVDFLGGAPAGGGALLEQAEGVVVVGGAEVAEVLQLGFLHGGAQGDDPGAGLQAELLAGFDDAA